MTPDNASKILLVEDDLSILTGLSINLRHEGFEVLQAQDGDRGLRRAIDDAPDLVILDVMLPGMNGFEVLKELRRRGLTLPIVMLSAKGMEQDKIMGLDLGADDYISKPFASVSWWHASAPSCGGTGSAQRIPAVLAASRSTLTNIASCAAAKR